MEEEKRRKYILGRTFLMCIISLMIIHCLDIISTIIGLNLGAYEVNPIARHLFSYGIFGFVAMSIFTISVFIITLNAPKLLSWFYRKATYQNMPLSLECSIMICLTASLFFGLAWTVLNNFLIITELLLR